MLFKRKYSLAIGNKNSPEFLLVEELEITFNISLNSNNKKSPDRATFNINNLSKDGINRLNKEFAIVNFSVGYGDTELDLVQLFTGEVVNISTTKQGTDRVTSITCIPAALKLNFSPVNKIVPAGRTVQDAIEEIRKIAGLSKGEYKGNRVNTTLPYGYPLSGTPRQMLDELVDTYLVEWRIQNNALYVNDEELGIKQGEITIPLITNETGLLEIPYYETEDDKKSDKDATKLKSLRFESLLNTDIKCGGYVKVVHDDIDGVFKVNEATYQGTFRGGNWTVNCKCTAAKEAV